MLEGKINEILNTESPWADVCTVEYWMDELQKLAEEYPDVFSTTKISYGDNAGDTYILVYTYITEDGKLKTNTLEYDTY